jgi:hypothetical protein
MRISTEQRLSVNKEQLIWRTLENDETVILNIKSGAYYSLNKVGTYIWKLLINGSSIKEVIHKIAEEYKLDEKDVRTDVIHFIDEMNSENLIDVLN